ncbi:MAG: DUF6515 family protein [Mucilaginibacter sp.]|uniref:DUF6515 family protein n=1 Tax=Mucilaginibacter sp. TaxID=1882438 RepID=UPI003266256C
MKSTWKNIMAIGASALCLLLIASTNVDAQRRGGSGRVSIGIRGGFGGPRFGFGFGYRSYRPYYGGFRYGYPGIGLSFGYLPYGYFPFYYGPDMYYGFDGVYYRQNNDKYEVVAAPVGAEVPKLPSHSKSIMINGEQYYELNGVYYKEVVHPDNTKGYLIAGKDGVLNTGQDEQPQLPKLGDIVDQLPQDCRTVTLNGKKFFVSPDDIYYEETVDNGGTTTYKVAGVPTEQNREEKQMQTPPPPSAQPE